MKKKTDEVKDRHLVRKNSLTIRVSDRDRERIERLRSLLSPFAPLSEGKTISAALELAEKHFKNG